VFEEAVDARLKLVLLSPAMVELERTLTGKLAFESERWRAVEAFLADLAVEVVPAPTDTPEAITGDPDDDLILASAIGAEVAVLISGDRRHLLPVGEHHGVRIVSPQALLAELRRG
jgi:predicted nucleic acid-binding protein